MKNKTNKHIYKCVHLLYYITRNLHICICSCWFYFS